MNVKKSLMAAAAVATVGLAGLGISGVASADTVAYTDGRAGLIDRLVAKFNLKEEDVRAVFEEERAAHEAERQQRIEDRLTQAVKDGKITEAQKAKIIAKLAELKAERESAREEFKNMTHDERRAHMEQKRDELKQWAEDNGLSEELLRSYVMGFKYGRHVGSPADNNPN